MDKVPRSCVDRTLADFLLRITALRHGAVRQSGADVPVHPLPFGL